METKWTHELIRDGNTGVEPQEISRHKSAAGDYGIAAVGNDGTAAAGDYGMAAAGDCGIATAGDCGIATAGDCGIATTGYRGTATAGYRGMAMAGDYGIIQIYYWDDRRRIKTGYIGEAGLKPNTRYCLNAANEFEEVELP